MIKFHVVFLRFPIQNRKNNVQQRKKEKILIKQYFRVSENTARLAAHFNVCLKTNCRFLFDWLFPNQEKQLLKLRLIVCYEL